MTYDITITFTVGDLGSPAEAEEFGVSLADHVMDTFNDNETISPLVRVKVRQKGRE